MNLPPDHRSQAKPGAGGKNEQNGPPTIPINFAKCLADATSRASRIDANGSSLDYQKLKAETLKLAKNCRCNKFLPFKFLPTEIRDQIWEAAIPEMSIIHIEITNSIIGDPRLGMVYSSPNLHSYSKMGGRLDVMLACKEAHQVVMSKLKGSLQIGAVDRDFYSGRFIRFDPTNDFIYFIGLYNVEFDDEEEDISYAQIILEDFSIAFKDIQNIVLPGTHINPGLRYPLSVFLNLKNMYGVLDTILLGDRDGLAELTLGSDPSKPTRIAGRDENLEELFASSPELRSYEQRLIGCYDMLDTMEEKLVEWKEEGTLKVDAPRMKLVGIKSPEDRRLTELGTICCYCF